MAYHNEYRSLTLIEGQETEGGGGGGGVCVCSEKQVLMRMIYIMVWT